MWIKVEFAREFQGGEKGLINLDYVSHIDLRNKVVYLGNTDDWVHVDEDSMARILDAIEKDTVREGEKVKVKLDDGAYMPERAHDLDAGYDLRTPISFVVNACGNAVIDTGVHIQIPKGYVGFLKSKSGLNVRYSITGEGVIDAGYTGSIRVKLYNNLAIPKVFEAGDKIIQLVLLPIHTPELEQVDELEDTERGSDGFGSTGR